MNSLLHKVMEIVADQFGEKIGDLTTDTRFIEDLHESLDFAETIMACKEAFGIDIPDKEAAKLVTIGQLTVYIERRLQPDGTIWPPSPKTPGSSNRNL